MKKVLILGCPGSGKSTFARKLSKKTELPIIYLDQLYWKADKTTVSEEELMMRVKTVVKNDQWIMDGNYLRTLPLRLPASDTIFFLDYHTQVCLLGVRARVGKKRPDMPWIEEKEDPVFIEFIKKFKDTQRPKILKYLQAAQNKNIHVFHSRNEAIEWLLTYKIEEHKQENLH